MAYYPVPISECDACGEREVEEPTGFTTLLGHKDGYFCRDCRSLLGNAQEEGNSSPQDLEK